MKLICTIIALALVLGVAIGVTLSQGESPPEGLTSEDDREETAEEKPQKIVVQRPVIIRDRYMPANSDVSDDLDDTPEKQEPQTPEEVASELEAQFQADGPPEERAREVEDTLLSAFDAPEAEGAEVTSLKCRANRCRLEVTFESDAEDSRIMEQVFLSGRYDTGLSGAAPERKVGEDGKVDVVIYLFPDTSQPESDLS
jgi:hypothetical protein